MSLSEELVGMIYDAAIGAVSWDRLLEEVAQASGSTTAALYLLDKRTNRVPVIASPRVDPAVLEEFATHIAPIDERLRFWSAQPELTVIHDALHTDEGAIDRSTYYAWMQKSTGTRYYAAAKLIESESSFAPLTLLRSKAQGPVQRPELDFVDEVVPHFRRALLVHQRLTQLQILERTAAMAVESVPYAIFLLGATGGILHRNRAAGALLSRRDALHDPAGQLHALRAGDDGLLQAALERGGSGSTLVLERSTGQRPYLVSITPVARHHLVFAELQAAWLVEVVDPDREPEANEKLLCGMFALTPAEARLASLLARGRSLEQAASALGIETSTARVHLHHVFRKTGTGRQSELVALLLRLSSGPR